jgi:hypothetical protein
VTSIRYQVIGKGKTMHRLARAACSAALLALLAVGSASAAKPIMFVINIGTAEWEADEEANLSAFCGFPIDFEGSGHIVVHQFIDSRRIVEINNFRLFQSYSANGNTIIVRPDSGPDVIWIAEDGDFYIALTGRSVTGSGVAGRTVFNISLDEFVSANGHFLGDFFGTLCTELAP